MVNRTHTLLKVLAHIWTREISFLLGLGLAVFMSYLLIIMLIKNNMWGLFAFESSPIDWCEKNFIILGGVAEFYNTISNVLFLIMPPLLIYLFRPYSKQVSGGANVVFLLLFVVGVGSAYFHWTLSLLGQLVDEIAILWVVMAAIAAWFPMRLLPSIFNGDRQLFQRIILVMSVISTGLCCVIPEVNAFVLMAFGGPIVGILVDEYKRSREARVRSLAVRTGIMWLMAVIFWTNDKFLCESVWHSFPYLHSGWHILIFLASYTACVLFAYFQVAHERPELSPKLRYWPKEGGWWEYWGIPYVSVSCESCHPDCSMCTVPADKYRFSELEGKIL